MINKKVKIAIRKLRGVLKKNVIAHNYIHTYIHICTYKCKDGVQENLSIRIEESFKHL